MYQPYALVVEISKTVDRGHLVKVMFDEVLSEGDAEGFAGELVGIVEEMVLGSSWADGKWGMGWGFNRWRPE